MRVVLLVVLLASPSVAQQAVQLSWTASTTPNTTARVYRAATCAGPWVLVGQGVAAAGPFNSIVPSAPGSSTAWQVTAFIPGSPESGPSNCFVLTIPTVTPPTPPASPSGLTVTPITPQ